jgi:hypothetical protein
MPRKRKPEPPVNEADTTVTTATVEPQIEMPVEQSPVEQPPTFVDRLGERPSRPVRPDPYTIALDSAAGVRLFEYRRDHVMAIKFDDKPAQPVIDMLKEADFRWNATDRVWTHPVRWDSALSTRIDAERLYQEVRQMIRHDKGIDAGGDIPF